MDRYIEKEEPWFGRTALKDVGLKAAPLGVLCWEARSANGGEVNAAPRAPRKGFWDQLEAMPGNVVNEKTFTFPLMKERVPGANFDTVVQNVTPEVRESFIAAAQRMAAEGASAVTTSCGFNAVFQPDLADAVTVPVFTSSLLQVPLAKALVGPSREVGIITADATKLSEAHLRACGVTDESVHIAGIENTSEFLKRNEEDPEVDPAEFVAQVVDTAEGLCRCHPRIGAIVLECTDLPPCSEAIRRALGLPVFDIVTLANYVQSAIGDRRPDHFAGAG